MNDVMTLGHDTQTISFDPTFVYIQSLVFEHCQYLYYYNVHH
jgi:hypothetical protein